MEFTPREQQIISLVREGLTNFQIAKRLGVRENTVTDCLTNIYEKLEIKTRYQMIVKLFNRDSVEGMEN